ncbi:MAG: hypothetical protein HGB33_01745 [Syntrophaceae bacterium]|nr:hypothetical protein [Syntrophaceae bacterium]
MKIALIEPYVSIDSLKSYAEKTEPSHLLGMFNLLQDAGCDVVLLDAYSSMLSAEDLIEWLEAGSFSHAGFTVYDYSPCLSYLNKIFKCLPKNINTIIGGPGPTYCMERMINILNPDWLVKGAGEKAMLDLFHTGFSRDKLAGSLTMLDRTAVISSDSMPLAAIPFKRPYSLDSYSFQASPRIQTGCVGKCIFCSGAYQKKFEYITEEKTYDQLDYLVNGKHAQVIAPNGPDLTAVPTKANDFINVLINGNFDFTEFRPGVRLDTLSRAVELEPEIWNKLSSRYSIKMESSIESFSIRRLNRLGKNIPSDFLEGIYSSLKKIFSNCDCTIVLGRIAIDPTITIDEFISDCTGFRRLLNEFSRRITVGGMLMNQFVPLHGTPATENEKPDNPWVNNEITDPAMIRLQQELLSNDKFKLWCKLAEDTTDFGERNFVFDEILRVAKERAIEVKLACAT